MNDEKLFETLTDIQTDLATIKENTRHLSRVQAEHTKKIESAIYFINWLKGLGSISLVTGVIFGITKIL